MVKKNVIWLSEKWSFTYLFITYLSPLNSKKGEIFNLIFHNLNSD